MPVSNPFLEGAPSSRVPLLQELGRAANASSAAFLQHLRLSTVRWETI